jgi:CheY-like chemotaxis protein
LLQNNTVDVILMDIHMPEMDGISATREIRRLEDPLKSKVPIIALTANILHQEKDECLLAGMNGFVIKPFTIEKLLNVIGKVVQKKSD